MNTSFIQDVEFSVPAFSVLEEEFSVPAAVLSVPAVEVLLSTVFDILDMLSGKRDAKKAKNDCRIEPYDSQMVSSLCYHEKANTTQTSNNYCGPAAINYYPQVQENDQNLIFGTFLHQGA